jgi:flavodoxin
MKKILIAYYSRTGITKKVGKIISAKLNCEVEEIFTVKNVSGVLGYLACGREAGAKKPADIKPTAKNPADYDLVIIGTPIWAWNLSSPVRAYLINNVGKFKNIACFCTMGGSGAENAFREMENITGLKSLTGLAVLTKEAKNCEEKINKFVDEINKLS